MNNIVKGGGGLRGGLRGEGAERGSGECEGGGEGLRRDGVGV